MNLSEIRRQIFDQMDFDPQLKQYRESLNRRINNHYQAISDSAHWLFMQREVKRQVRVKVEGSATAFLEYDASNIRRLISPKTATSLRVTTAAAASADSTVAITQEMEGQTFIDHNDNEYTIVRVVSDREMFIDPALDTTGLSSATMTSWSIRFDKYLLPEDCIEVLGVMDRTNDRGRLVYFDRKVEEHAYLDADNTGEPQCIIEDESVAGMESHNIPTVAVDTATTGTLNTSTDYEYMYTIRRNGIEGPPSQVASVSTGTSTAVTVSGLDTLAWNQNASPTDYYDSGIQKFVYRRNATQDGPWILVKVLESTAAHTGSTTDTTSFTDSTDRPGKIGKYLMISGYYVTTDAADHVYNAQSDHVLWQDPGPRQSVRFWYTPGTDATIHIRYHRRPRPLYNDHSSPEWPRQYHQLLVYATLEDMFLQMQEIGQAQVYNARMQELIKQMRRRYLSRDEARKRFVRFDRPRRYRSIFGPPALVPSQ